LAGGALLWVAAAASAQPIRIPDFRESPLAVQAPKPGEKCEHCGVIRSVREIQSQRPVEVPKVLQNQPTDSGMGSTVYVGAVVYLPLGKGTDKPFVGGVGTPEMRDRFNQSTYEVAVQLDTGGTVFVQRDDGASYRAGDRVQVQGNQLELLVN
jgi:outer membrane lipoprotein SlyB